MTFSFKFPSITLKLAGLFLSTWQYYQSKILIGIHPKGVLVYGPFVVVRFPYDTGAEKDFGIKASDVLSYAPKITDELLNAHPVVYGTFSKAEEWPFDRVTLEWAGKPLQRAEFIEAHSIPPIRILFMGADTFAGSFATTLERLKVIRRIAELLVEKEAKNFIAFTIEPVEEPGVLRIAGEVTHYRRAYFAIWDIRDPKSVVADGFLLLFKGEETRFSKKMADPWVKT
jgi:hypothetical protein